MGRKSNTKKKVREMLKESDETEQKSLKKSGKKQKKKAKAEAKKKIKSKKVKNSKSEKAQKTKKKKTPKIPLKEKLKAKKENILAGAFTIIMLALLLAVGNLLFYKAFKPVDIAKYLPADKTVLSLELNIDSNHNQVDQALQLTRNNPLLGRDALQALFDEVSSFTYESDLSLWLGRSAGLAVLNSEKTDSGLNMLSFFEVSSSEELMNVLKKKKASVSTYKGYETYLVEELYTALIDKYIFVAASQKEIFELIDHQSTKKLYDSQRFRRVDDNLPLNKLAFLYVDYDQINDNIFQNFTALSEQGLSLEQLRPMFSVFESEGIALVSMEENFALQSFLSLNETILDPKYAETFDVKYNAELADYVAKDAIAFWGGYDLSDQITRFISVLSGESEENKVIFASLAQSLTSKYFGTDVSFNQDLLPLMDKEFIYALEPVVEFSEDFEDTEELALEFAHKVIFHLDAPADERNKIFELANNFATLGAIFEPRILERILEDGSIAKELVAIPEEITTAESEYKDYQIQNLIMGKQDWGISYAIIDDIAIISTSESSVKKSIDLVADPSDSFRQAPVFTSQIEPVLRSADEVSYLQIGLILEQFFPEFSSPISSSIESLSSGRNYFNDGIITINYLKVN